MAANLVSHVMQFMTPDTISRIAATLGLDRAKTQSAIGAAVPGLLAGFSSIASQPGGAQRLADAVKQQSVMPGNFSNMLSGGGQTSLVDKGSQMLSSLLGTREETALAGAVGTYAGMSRGTSDSLLGMLAPVVMGTIAQERDPRELDGRSIAGFLASQKDSIAGALPSGFGNLLSGTGLLNSVGSAGRAAAAAGAQTSRAATSAAYAVGDAGRRVTDVVERKSSSWLYWVIGMALVAGLVFYTLSQAPRPAAVQPTGVQSLVVDGVNIRNQVSDSMSGLRSTLAGVTDTASAENALPRLREISSQLDRVAALKGQMTAGQRAALTGLINPEMSVINTTMNRALANPGVADVLRPVLNPLIAKLTALAA